MSQAAFINPTLLAWSRERAGLSEAQLAKKLQAKPERVRTWETGQSLPTFKQAQHWANVVHVPFGFLFLKEPPVEKLALPDLRTVGNVAPQRPSLNLMDTVKEVMAKQQWYLEYLDEHGREPLPFVGRFDRSAAVADVVADMRATLATDPHAGRFTYEEYARHLIQACEAIGILVMRSGVALGNTHRKLDVGEFRGFAISNVYAPVVFINSADAPTARLFTLMHELAHLWIGSSGISDGGGPDGRQEEVFCNAVAGEFLVPEQQLRKLWQADIDWQQNLAPLASHFHVSTLVIGRRARDLGLVTREAYSAYYLQVLQAYRDKEGGGGDYYRTATAKNSARFSKAVLAQTMSGRMLLREAGALLGVQPAKLKTYAGKLTE